MRCFDRCARVLDPIRPALPPRHVTAITMNVAMAVVAPTSAGDRRKSTVSVFNRLALIPWEQFPRSILVTSSSTRQTSSRGYYEDVARVGRLPRSACHALTATGRPTVCCGVVLPVGRVSCRSPNSTSPTRTTCCGQIASILVAPLSDSPISS